MEPKANEEYIKLCDIVTDYKFCKERSTIVDNDINVLNTIIAKAEEDFTSFYNTITKNVAKHYQVYELEVYCKQAVLYLEILTKKYTLEKSCTLKVHAIDVDKLHQNFFYVFSILLSKLTKREPNSRLVKQMINQLTHVIEKLKNANKKHIQPKDTDPAKYFLKIKTLIKTFTRQYSEFMHINMRILADFTGVQSLINRATKYELKLSGREDKLDRKGKGKYTANVIERYELMDKINKNKYNPTMNLPDPNNKAIELDTELDIYCLSILNGFGSNQHYQYFQSAESAGKYIEQTIIRKMGLIMHSKDYRRVINSCTALLIVMNMFSFISKRTTIEEILNREKADIIKEIAVKGYNVNEADKKKNEEAKKGKEAQLCQLTDLIYKSLKGVMIDDPLIIQYYYVSADSSSLKLENVNGTSYIGMLNKCIMDILSGYIYPRESIIFYLLQIKTLPTKEITAFLDKQLATIESFLALENEKHEIKYTKLLLYYVTLRGICIVSNGLMSFTSSLDETIREYQDKFEQVFKNTKEHMRYLSHYIAYCPYELVKSYPISITTDVINEHSPLDIVHAYINGRKEIIDNLLDKFSSDIVEFVKKLLPTTQFTEKVNEIFNRVDESLRNNVDAEFKLSYFGSLVNGTSTLRSDIDLAILFPTEYGKQPSEVFMKVYKTISSNFSECKIKTISKRLLLLNFIDKESGMDCDLNVNSVLGMVNATFFNYLTQCDERFHYLAIWLKEFAKNRKIQGADKQFPTSYAYMCMLTVLLINLNEADQSEVPILPNLIKDSPSQKITFLNYKVRNKSGSQFDKLHSIEVMPFETDIGFNKDIPTVYKGMKSSNINIGKLALLFFKFYGYIFNPYEFTISVKQGCFVKRDQSLSKLRTFSIEDPFDHKHNPGQTISKEGWERMQIEFRKAYTTILMGNKLQITAKV